ncbi:MAG: isoprenylcysteine carboxylmethyltransferase family protein [Nitrospiraceae bacterium]|nr:MAG: isoprenylcysteine carboxylmethyltransferase family protein [Nitrospiraceae bacterium]
MIWHEATGRVILVFLSFAFIHSLCVTSFIKSQTQRLLGETFVKVFYRFVYTCFSVITAAIAAHLINMIPDIYLLTGPAWFRWIMHSIQISGLIFGILSFKVINSHEFLGIAQVWRYMTKKEIKGDVEGITQARLVKTGVYGIVRHPLYLAGIIIFTFEPNITRNWLTVSILADIYFIFGAFMEEKRLIKIFGDEYIEYMKQVPRFLPRISLNNK